LTSLKPNEPTRIQAVTKNALWSLRKRILEKGTEYNIPENIEILPDEPSQQDINKLDNFDTIFIDRSTCRREGTQSRGKHQGSGTVTSIISREKRKVDQIYFIFQNIIREEEKRTC
jgi:hypothetical protein